MNTCANYDNVAGAAVGSVIAICLAAVIITYMVLLYKMRMRGLE